MRKRIGITPLVTIRDTRSIEIYLKEISKIQLLSADEEVRLAKLAAVGCKKSKEALISANLRFVVSIAKRYTHEKVNLIDIIMNGNIGLIEAVERFDHTKGFKLISFAVWHIRKQIVTFLKEHADLIRKPTSFASHTAKMKAFDESADSMTEDEIAQAIGVPIGEMRIAKFADVRIVEMDAPISEDSETGLEVEGYFYADSALLESERGRYIQDALKTMKPLHRDVICKRYGLMGEPALRFEEIGEYIGKTQERARQLVKRCEKELKNKLKKFDLQALY